MLHPNAKSFFDAKAGEGLPDLKPATLIATGSNAVASDADTDMQRNIDFVTGVVTQGQTIYDGYGTPVHHTHDMDFVGEVLDATGDRHFGVHMTGMRPL